VRSKRRGLFDTVPIAVNSATLLFAGRKRQGHFERKKLTHANLLRVGCVSKKPWILTDGEKNKHCFFVL
jgi:hypothetical protein